MPRKLFISYSHHDADLLGELRVHLRPLERAGIIAPWFDGYLVPGDDFDREVRAALAASDFIGLLVTPRFLASDYCVEVEMQDAVTRHQAGQARVVPIIAKPCQWKDTYLSKLLATPKDGKPVSQWAEADEAWNIVAHDMAAAAKQELRPASTVPLRPEPAPDRFGGTAVAPFSVKTSRKPTDQEIDEFLVSAFEEIAARFEASIHALADGFSGRYRRLDANRFTATIYRAGARSAGCTVFTGGHSFGPRGIAYSGQDTGETNTMNEQLTADVQDGQLGFKVLMGSIMGRQTKGLLTSDEAAEHFWKLLTDRMR